MKRLETIADRMPSLNTKAATLGFDGFIDYISKVVRQKANDGDAYFESMKEFGEYILGKGDKSFSIELDGLTTKLGGNVPITANALAHLGAKVACIASLGYPDIHPAFKAMPSNCKLYSFANPGISNLLEFQSGKIMLAEMKTLNAITWEFVKETIGVNTIADLFRNSDLIALLNWSELDNSTAFWKGILKDVMPKLPSDQRSIGFFDLSDCSRRNTLSIKEALDLIKSFSNWWNIALSLNMNEAMIVHSVLSDAKETDQRKLCEDIHLKLDIGTVVIHNSKEAVARDKGGLCSMKSFPLTDPAIATGAGDNFNAGFSSGMLLDLDTELCLALGHATSALYMRSGRSPSANDVLRFLSNAL